jgi:type VI protein secretion system component VasK
MPVQTTLQLFGASAVMASALIFVCRPVLMTALRTMRRAQFPIARMIFIGLWALVVVVTVLWVASTTAVALHAPRELEPPLQNSQRATPEDIPSLRAKATRRPAPTRYRTANAWCNASSHEARHRWACTQPGAQTAVTIISRLI